MKFILKPSLQHMILVKIVVSLWNHKDVRFFIQMNLRFLQNFNYTSEKWKKIEDRVIKIVPELSLPHLLKEKVLGFIKPIGVQILEWIKFHSRQFIRLLNLPAEFCWTQEGAIDRKKTAELLIKDDNMDIAERYKIACVYCFEEDINKFWKNMPEILKESISKKSPIINFWTRNMRRRGSEHISYGLEFHQSACWDNKVGAEYFLQKLSPSEREHYLVDTAKFVKDADVLCFLLSEMEEEQQLEVFKKNPSRVLSCFLQWPLQSCFFEVTNCMYDFLSVEGYNELLRNIVKKVTDGYKDWNYQKLFSEIYQVSPNALKNFIVKDIRKDGVWLLPSLCHIKDKENIRLILKDATPSFREKLIDSEKMYNFCETYIRNNEWDFLEFYIRECFPSKNEMLKFKEEFEKSIICPFFKKPFGRNKQKWDQIFIFSDDSFCKYDKRSAEEGECSSSKRFQSLQ